MIIPTGKIPVLGSVCIWIKVDYVKIKIWMMRERITCTDEEPANWLLDLQIEWKGFFGNLKIVWLEREG